MERPKAFWKKETSEYSKEQFYNKIASLHDELDFIFHLNKWADSAVGSEMLLQIISMERGEFIKSRIIRYYSISVILVGIQLSMLGFSDGIVWKAILIAVVFLIGLLVFGFDSLYTRLSKDDVFYLIPELEYHIYCDYIKTTLEGSILTNHYKITPKRRFFQLDIKENSYLKELVETFYEKIHIIAIDKNIAPIQIAIKKYEASQDLVIYISEDIPELWIQNEITRNKQCLIVAGNSDEILAGIQQINPIIKR